VLFLLTAVCVGVFLAEERAGGSEVREVLLRFGASRPAHVRTGEWWRFATALFVHIGPRHLLGNMAALLVLGPALVAALGPWRFLFVYFLAGIAGNALSYQTMPPDVVSAGASGAILGVLGALGGQRLRFAQSARYRGWQVIAALLAYLAVAVGAEPGVDTMAHLGGLAAGLILGLLIPRPRSKPARFLEAPVERGARRHHDRHHRRIAERRFELGHELEVHAVDAGDRRRDREDGGPARELLRHLVLLHRDEREIGLQRRRSRARASCRRSR
jgi:rhomboid protease GluP